MLATEEPTVPYYNPQEDELSSSSSQADPVNAAAEYLRFQELKAERLRQQSAEFQKKQAEAILRQIAFEEKWRQSHSNLSNTEPAAAIRLVHHGVDESSSERTEETAVVSPRPDANVCAIDLMYLCIL